MNNENELVKAFLYVIMEIDGKELWKPLNTTNTIILQALFEF